MTREEAIEMLVNATYSEEWQGNEKLTTAHLMAIEALEGVCYDEWCYDCKEYDTEKKCCPRFNRVIREALKREPSEDGTLEVKVEDATKVGRVLISDDEHRGGLYYPDEDEPQSVSFENDTEIKSCSKDSDLISREAAKDIAFRSPFFSDALMEELDALPSADRPRGEWVYHEDYKLDGECCYECSECGRMYDYKMNYCGYCGADMRGEDK